MICLNSHADYRLSAVMNLVGWVQDSVLTTVMHQPNTSAVFFNNSVWNLALFLYHIAYSISSVRYSVLSDSLQPHGRQHTWLLCPTPTPIACSNSCPLDQWCHPTMSSSVIPFSSCPQSFPASGSFPMSQFFTSGGQHIGVYSKMFIYYNFGYKKFPNLH